MAFSTQPTEMKQLILSHLPPADLGVTATVSSTLSESARLYYSRRLKHQLCQWQFVLPSTPLYSPNTPPWIAYGINESYLRRRGAATFDFTAEQAEIWEAAVESLTTPPTAPLEVPAELAALYSEQPTAAELEQRFETAAELVVSPALWAELEESKDLLLAFRPPSLSSVYLLESDWTRCLQVLTMDPDRLRTVEFCASLLDLWLQRLYREKKWESPSLPDLLVGSFLIRLGGPQTRIATSFDGCRIDFVASPWSTGTSLPFLPALLQSLVHIGYDLSLPIGEPKDEFDAIPPFYPALLLNIQDHELPPNIPPFFQSRLETTIAIVVDWMIREEKGNSGMVRYLLTHTGANSQTVAALCRNYLRLPSLTEVQRSALTEQLQERQFRSELPISLHHPAP